MIKKRSIMKQNLSLLVVLGMVLYLAVFAAEAKDTKSREAKYIIPKLSDFFHPSQGGRGGRKAF